jgi:hypothetical protein
MRSRLTLRVTRSPGAAAKSGSKRATEAWKRVHDGAHALQEEHGMTAAMVFHNGNEVLVLTEWPDAGCAEGFQADPRLREAMQSAGVIGVPDISWPWNRDT